MAVASCLPMDISKPFNQYLSVFFYTRFDFVDEKNIPTLRVEGTYNLLIYFSCLVSLVVLSLTARGLGFDSQVQQKVLFGFCMKIFVAAWS